MTAKNDDNTQFARVANADGSSPIAAGAANDGLAPLVDSAGRLITVQYSGGGILSGDPTFVDSQMVTVSQLISATPCKLYQAWGAQASGVMLWLQLFNLAASPPGGAVVPHSTPLPVQNNGMWSQSFESGLTFSTGLVIAYSTAQGLYVAPAVGGWISALIR